MIAFRIEKEEVAIRMGIRSHKAIKHVATACNYACYNKHSKMLGK